MRTLREAFVENPNRVIIEKANHSVDLIRRVRKYSQRTFQVIEGTHGGFSKEGRFVRIQHKINTGQVYLAKGVDG